MFHLKVLKLPASPQTGQEFLWVYRGEIRGNPIPNQNEIEAGFPSSGGR